MQGQGYLTVLLLVLSNAFMTMAWYGHLKIFRWMHIKEPGMFITIVFSWGIAFFEYCLMVPANRLGYLGEGGVFTVWQLKIIQEVVSVLVFTLFAIFFSVKNLFSGGIYGALYF